MQRVHFGDVDGFFGVEYQQQTARQLVHAQNQFARDALQRFGRALEGLFLHFEHVADFVDEQAERAVGRAHDDVHRQLVFGTLGRVEAAAQIDRDDDLPAQVDEAADHARHQRHARHFLVADDFLHLLHRHAEELAIDVEGAELLRVATRSSLPGRNRRFEKVGIRRADESAHVEQIGDALLDHRRAEQTLALRRLLRDDGFFDDVENAIDDQADAAALLGVDDDLQRGGEVALAVAAAPFEWPLP